MRTLVYDGDCGFCTASVRWVGRLHLGADTVIPWQQADLASMSLTEEQASQKLQYVDESGLHAGHEAVAHLLMSSAAPWRVAGRVLLLPGISPLAARAYTWVAAHRGQLPGATPACQLPQDQRPTV